jgi:hypothetical protein
MKTVHTLTLYFFIVHFNIILPFTPKPPLTKHAEFSPPLPRAFQLFAAKDLTLQFVKWSVVTLGQY